MMNPLYWVDLRIRVREKRLWIVGVFSLVTLAVIGGVVLASALAGSRMVEPAGVGAGMTWAVLYTQAAMLVVLAPLAAAGRISLEREQRTLPALINTPASRLGIAFGKLLGAWTFVGWLACLALPFLLVGTLWGGPPWPVVLGCAAINICAGLTLSAVSLGFSGFFGRSLTSYLVTGAFLFGWIAVVPMLGGLVTALAELSESQADVVGYFAWYHNPFFPLILLGSEEWGLSTFSVVVRLAYCLGVWAVLTIWGLFQAVRGLKREVF